MKAERTSFDLQRTVKTSWLTRILPESVFLDPKLEASAEALDDEISKLAVDVNQVLHIPRLDELSGVILDLLAEQFHVDNYDAINFSDAEKRNFIRQSIAWHRIKGTPAAVKMVLQDAFKDLQLDEWFTYGGEPYYFRLRSKGYTSTPERFKSFWRMFMDAKNVRSHLERIIVEGESNVQLYTGVAQVVSGLKAVGLHRPNMDMRGRITTGVAFIVGGFKTVKLPRPPQTRNVRITTSVFTIQGGVVYRFMKEDPLLPEDEFFGEGDYLRLYFDYPTGRDHPVLLKNPRDDLINGDIKEVGDFAKENGIFINQKAEATLGVRRAALIRGWKVTPENDETILPNTGVLRLFWGFPTGNKHRTLLHNRRNNIYLKDIREFGDETAKNKLLVNAYNEKTSGITHAALVKNFIVSEETYHQPVKF